MKDTMNFLPPEGRLASVNGIGMYYETHGQGSPLILLHAFTEPSQLWRFHTTEFANHYRTISIDLRGHGWSTNPSNEFTRRQCALGDRDPHFPISILAETYHAIPNSYL